MSLFEFTRWFLLVAMFVSYIPMLAIGFRFQHATWAMSLSSVCLAFAATALLHRSTDWQGIGLALWLLSISIAISFPLMRQALIRIGALCRKLDERSGSSDT